MLKYRAVAFLDILGFKDLISNLQCKYIAVSYNNTYSPKSSSSRNKIQLEEIEEVQPKKLPSKTKTANMLNR